MENTLLVSMLKDFSLTSGETLGIMWLTVILTIITSIFVNNGWITRNQSVVTDIIISLLDMFVILTSSDIFIVILIGIQFFINVASITFKVLDAHHESTAIPLPVFSAPDNTIICATVDIGEWYFIAYDNDQQKYLCYKNHRIIDNVSPEELYSALYNDVLQKDAYSYRCMYEMITNNQKPNKSNFDVYPLWTSNVGNIAYKEGRIQIIIKVVDIMLKKHGICSNKTMRIEAEIFSPSENKIHAELDKEEINGLWNMDKDSIYRTELNREEKADVLGSDV